jgi:hypothetical protein
MITICCEDCNLFELKCDICGIIETEMFDSFQDAVDFKTDTNNGWRSRKEDDEWLDICWECQEDLL